MVTDKALLLDLNRFLDPLTRGEYPRSMRSILGNRLPKFTNEQSELLKGSYDFIGVNYYASVYAKNNPARNSLQLSYNTDPQANQTGTRKSKAVQFFLLTLFGYATRKHIDPNNFVCIAKIGTNSKGVLIGPQVLKF